MNRFVYVVAIRETLETETDIEAWREGNFEPYNWYDDREEAVDVARHLNLTSDNLHTWAFVHRASLQWCENNIS